MKARPGWTWAATPSWRGSGSSCARRATPSSSSSRSSAARAIGAARGSRSIRPIRSVREVFVRLWDEGLIYRGHRVIHWCPHCLTALSDEEAEHHETQGNLYHIKYPLEDGSG